MSFTTFVSALGPAISALSGFTAKTELPNAYDLENCGPQFRRDGWGLIYGGSREDTAQHDSAIRNNSSFGVVLTREVLSDRTSAVAFTSAVCAMKEDALTLQRALLSTHVLGLTDCEIIRYEMTSPVRYGNQESNNWVTLTVNFNATLIEKL